MNGVQDLCRFIIYIGLEVQDLCRFITLLDKNIETYIVQNLPILGTVMALPFGWIVI